MRPFRCPVTILNTLDHLGKFDGKADEGFFVGYSINSKAFRVFNSRTRIIEETLHITFLQNKPNVAGSGPEWIFDIDTLTKSMNYKLVVVGNQTIGNAGTKESIDPGQARKKTVPSHEYKLLPLWTPDSPISSSIKSSDDKDLRELERLIVQGKEAKININSTNSVSAISSPVNTARTKDADVNKTNSIYNASPLVNFDGLSYFNANLPDDPKIPNLEDTSIFGGAYDDEDFVAGGEMNNLESSIPVSPIATTRVHKDHPFNSKAEENKPQRLSKLMSFYSLNCKRAIGTKWVYKNKARLVAQGYTQEDGIYYDDVFAPVARIETDVKSAFLYRNIEEEVYIFQPLGFEDLEFPNRVYKVEKALYGLHQAPRVWYETLSTYLLENRFQRGTIDKTLFIKIVKGDIQLVQIYVDDIIFGSTKKELCIEFEKLMHKKFQMSSIGELTFFLGLQVMQKEDGICISQDKYVDKILKKFGFSTMRIASTPIETSKPLLKDAKAEDVDVHLYRSMIGSLMYLTSSRPNIMLAGVFEKSEDNADFAEIVDFLNASPIRYALIVSPTVYVSYIEQFWSTIKIKTVNNETQIRAKVDGKTIVITQSFVRRDLHFDDEDGITCLTNTEIFENLQLMGYEKLSDKLTVLKPLFSPQWKYLIHTILQCLSSKSTACNEFGRNELAAKLGQGEKSNESCGMDVTVSYWANEEKVSNSYVSGLVIRVKQKQLNLGVGTERMIFTIDSAIKHSYSNDDTCFSIDVIDEILEEDFDALLDEGSKILHSIEGTVLEEEIFSEFKKFIAMNADENYHSTHLGCNI
ncbi:putative ribonuclease H-like domain-containing protein [Tanacetum coccineum]|uniref:Ribonuclease H-like domain-containing protein n=1 Tax=Tanacetum coccineum TaxID=301880 RepID=A0ABQ5GGU2_9ASTR